MTKSKITEKLHQAEAEAARQRLGATIDDIQARVSPDVLIDSAVEAARKQGLSAVVSAKQKIADNPTAVSLMGAALGWWLMSRKRKTTANIVEVDMTDRDEQDGNYESRMRRGWSEAKQTADSARQNVKQTAGAARDYTSEKLVAARERTKQTAERARVKAEQAREKTAERIDKNPLTALLVGAAAGFLAGALLPRTRRENALMGGTRDKLANSAKSAALAARAAGMARFDELGIKDRAAAEITALSTEAKEIARKAANAITREADHAEPAKEETQLPH